MSASKRTDAKSVLFKQRLSGEVLKTKDGSWRPKVVAAVEKRLARRGASPDFDHLVDIGCRREDLLDCLVWIGPFAKIEDSQAALTGFSRAKLKTVLNRMRRCADEVELILSLGHTDSLLSGELQSPLEDLPYVPTMLRLYAEYVEGVSSDSSLRERSSFTRNIGIWHLVMIVNSVTGKFYDKEVSSLISALLNRPAYDAVLHRQWRKEHSKEMATPLDRYFSSYWGRISKSPPGSKKDKTKRRSKVQENI